MSTTAPFGLVLPSRPVLTDPTIVSPTQYAFTFTSTPTFSHIIVFLLPGATLPNDTLSGVYIQLPSSTEFKFLGAIGTEKPSAIFRVSGGTTENGTATTEDEMTDVDVSSEASGEAGRIVTLGLSVEPAANIAAQLETLKASQTAVASTRGLNPQQQQPAGHLHTKVLAQRIIKNAYNFLGGFAGSTSAGGPEVIPLKSFQDWWKKFERRIENDPGFLEREVTD